MKITHRQLRQIISENRQQDLENKKELDAWLATGKSKEEFPDYDEWGKEYIESLEKVEESIKITRNQLRQIIKEELGRLNEGWTFDNEKEIDDAIASVKSDMKTPEGYEPGENERLLNRLITAKKKGKYPVEIQVRPTRS